MNIKASFFPNIEKDIQIPIIVDTQNEFIIINEKKSSDSYRLNSYLYSDGEAEINAVLNGDESAPFWYKTYELVDYGDDKEVLYQALVKDFNLLANSESKIKKKTTFLFTTFDFYYKQNDEWIRMSGGSYKSRFNKNLPEGSVWYREASSQA